MTGGARGLGRAMSRAFASEGAYVVSADHDEDYLSDTVSELEEEFSHVLAVPTDVQVWDDVQRLVETTRDHYGEIDVWVNNAGVQQRTAGAEKRSPIVDVPVDIWDTVIETNLRGAFLCTKAVVPGMLERNAGRMIHISSGHGLAGRTNRAPYVASKFGLEGFHESLSLELAEAGVDSVAFRPPDGGVFTESSRVYGKTPSDYTHESPKIVAEAAVRLAAGEGENGGRYKATPDGEDYTRYVRSDRSK